MLHTTFNYLELAGACGQRPGSGTGYDKLATHLGGSRVYGKNTPIPLAVVVESNGLPDALWCLRATTEDFSTVVHPFIRGYLTDVLEHLAERVTFLVNMIDLFNATALLRSLDNDNAALLRSPADTHAVRAAHYSAYVTEAAATVAAYAIRAAYYYAAATCVTIDAFNAAFDAERKWQTKRFLAALGNRN